MEVIAMRQENAIDVTALFMNLVGDDVEKLEGIRQYIFGKEEECEVVKNGGINDEAGI